MERPPKKTEEGSPPVAEKPHDVVGEIKDKIASVERRMALLQEDRSRYSTEEDGLHAEERNIDTAIEALKVEEARALGLTQETRNEVADESTAAVDASGSALETVEEPAEETRERHIVSELQEKLAEVPWWKVGRRRELKRATAAEEAEEPQRRAKQNMTVGKLQEQDRIKKDAWYSGALSEVHAEIETRYQEKSELQRRSRGLRPQIARVDEAYHTAQWERDKLEDQLAHEYFKETPEGKREGDSLTRIVEELKRQGREDIVNAVGIVGGGGYGMWEYDYESMVVRIEEAQRAYAAGEGSAEQLWTKGLGLGFLNKSVHNLFSASILLNTYFPADTIGDTIVAEDLKKFLNQRVQYVQQIASQAGVTLETPALLEKRERLKPGEQRGHNKDKYEVPRAITKVPEIKWKVKETSKSQKWEGFTVAVFQIGVTNTPDGITLPPLAYRYNLAEWM